MQTTTCTHKEKIENVGRGIEIGTCRICNQICRYNTADHHDNPRIIKLGRVNGAIVLPGMKALLELSIQEGLELEAAKKVSNERPQSPSNTKISQGDQVAVATPPKPKKRSLLQKYFEENKEAILQDYQNLKLKEFYAKWHMSSTTWLRLKRDWGIQRKAPRESTKRPQIQKLPEHGVSQLPAFPSLNEQWSDYVKRIWFETYQALKELEVK